MTKIERVYRGFVGVESRRYGCGARVLRDLPVSYQGCTRGR